jgi:putative transposase
LPADFPPWKTVFHVFRKWTLNHLWAALNDALRILVRKTHDKRSQPTEVAILDSQSVKSDGHGVALAMTPPSGSRAASGICWWILWG